MASGTDFVVKTDIQGASTWRQQLDGCVTVRLLGIDPDLPLEEHRRDLLARLDQRGASAAEKALRLEELVIEYVSNVDDYTVVTLGSCGRRRRAAARDCRAERHNADRPRPRLHDSHIGAIAR